MWKKLSITGLAVAATACAGLAVDDSPEQAVARKAREYWKLMVAQDYQGAYRYLTPGFREIVDAEAYAKRYRGKVEFHSAEFDAPDCQPETCEINVHLDYTIKPVPPYSVEFRRPDQRTEKWIFLDGQWWLAPKK